MATRNKTTQTSVDTICFTPEQAESWPLPEFQRGPKVNAKVLALAEKLKEDGGVLPGVIHFGILDRKTYLIDGCQRRQAFLLSGQTEGFADTVKHFCSSFAEMAELFFELNGHLVGMKPDDGLKALEFVLPPLAELHKRCPFIGYDAIRRDHSALLSMSVAIRCWAMTRTDTPGSGGMVSAANLAQFLTMDDAREAAAFFNLCHSAFGRDESNYRLWTGLNLTICGWMYKRLVLMPTDPIRRSTRMNDDLFRKCLMSLSADESYVDWLLGRRVCARDRAPAYNRIKAIFIKRLNVENGQKNRLPTPAWAHG